MSSRGAQHFSVCHYMTRNKLISYYDHIMHNLGCVMRKYIKDNNGDQASLINGQIEGLFFGTSVDQTTQLPPNWSHFGPKRLNVPAHLLITPRVKLYFADFYCNKKAHYVTLVLCHPGSNTHKFCAGRLYELDKYTNPFLRLSSDGNMGSPPRVVVTQKIWVEVLYTEDIHIPSLLESGAAFTLVDSTGTSRPEGIPKNPNCATCNLYR